MRILLTKLVIVMEKVVSELLEAASEETQDKWHEKWGLASLYDNPVPPPHFSGLVKPSFFFPM